MFSTSIITLKGQQSIHRIHYDVIQSTQDKANIIRNKVSESEWIVITANHQTSAKGQYNRKWYAPKDSNIYATYVFTIQGGQNNNNILCIPQTTVLAIIRTVEHYGIKNAKFKWINDAYINLKKFAGVLVESEYNYNKNLFHISLGIGINVNTTKVMLRNNVDQPATSCFVESNKIIDTEEVFRYLSFNLIKYITSLSNNGFSTIKIELEDKLEKFNGENIVFEKNKGEYIFCKIKGLDENYGALIAEVEGKNQKFYNGRIICKK